MKFKDFGEGWFQVGISNLFVRREAESGSVYWTVWEREGDNLHQLKYCFRGRKWAVEYYLKKPKERSGETMPIPVKPKREKPEHLTSFTQLLKNL